MTRQCTVCRRGALKVISRSHSNRPTIRRQYVNIQSRWLNGKQIAICANCIKTQKKRVAQSVPTARTKKQ